MIINGKELLKKKPILDMESEKLKAHGYSYGLSEVGYDFRTRQRIEYYPPDVMMVWRLMGSTKTPNPSMKNAIEMKFFGYTKVIDKQSGDVKITIGKCALVNSVEYFQLPNDLWGDIKNKSTHARNFVDAVNCTDAEPGWNGHLTIELTFNDISKPVMLPAGTPIAKMVFHQIAETASYGAGGTYQNQPDYPVEARMVY